MANRCKHLTDLGSFGDGTRLTIRVEGDPEAFVTRLLLESTDADVNKKWIPQGKLMGGGFTIQVGGGHLYQATLFTGGLTEEPTEVTVVWERDGKEIYRCGSRRSKSDGVADWAFWIRGE